MISDVTNIIGLVASVLSMVGSCFIIVCYYKLPELKTFGNKLIMYVGCSNLVYSMSTMAEYIIDMSSSFGGDYMTVFCKMESYLSTYTGECNLIWITILSITIFDTVKNRVRNMAKREKIFIYSGFFIPGLLSAIPFATQSYGYQDGHCWITSNRGQGSQLAQTWGLYFGPLWVCIVVNIVLILKTLAILQKLEIGCTETYYVIRRFLYYPLLWVICSLPGTVNRAVSLFGNDGVPGLLDISGASITLQGFLISVLFLSDPRIRDAIRNRFSTVNTSIDSLSQKGDEEEQFQADDSNDVHVKLLDDSNDQYHKQGHPNYEQQKQKQEYRMKQKETQYQESVEVYQSQQSPQQIKKKRNKRSKRTTQKQQFQNCGKWNKMEKIEEDSDEEQFDKEIQDQNIDRPDLLVLSINDAKTLYKHHKMAVSSASGNEGSRHE